MNLYANQKEVTIFDEKPHGILSKLRSVESPSQDEVSDILSEQFNFVEISPKIPVSIVDSIPVIAKK